MSSVNLIQPKRENIPVTPICGAGSSTIPDHISKLLSASRDFQQLEAQILEREEKLKRNAEDFKTQLQTLGVKHSDLQKKYENVEVEKLKLEVEAKRWKRESEEHKEELTRAMEELRVLSEREKRSRERYNNLLADSEKEMMKMNQELNEMKEKIGQAEDLDVLLHKKCEKCESRVDKLEANMALYLRADPAMAKDAGAMLTAVGMCFNDLIVKEYVESTVPTGNASKDFIEIDDSDDAMHATGKRPLGCTLNNMDLDDDASITNRKRIKNLSLPNMSNANESSDSSDNSITDSYMDKLAFGKSTTSKPLVSGKSKGKKFESEADMLRSINEDDELCMNAVCAIYRGETTSRSFSQPDAISRFSPSDAIRGRSLAKFLIDGDQQGRLRKSVKDLQEHYSKVIELCRKLASDHLSLLFQIYQKEEDPFFCPSMI